MDKEEILAKQWHRIYQLSYNSQGNKFVEAEAIRNRLFLLDHHKPHTGAYEDMFSKLCDDYSKLVDSEKGLDGYKNTLLADASTSQNRSRFWKSELSVERCLEMPNISSFFNQLKELSVNDNKKSPPANQRKLKWVEDVDPPVHHSRPEPDEPSKVTSAFTKHESHHFQQGASPGKPSHYKASDPCRREFSHSLPEPMSKKSKLEAKSKGFAKGGYQNARRNERDMDDESGDDKSQGRRKESLYNQSFKTAKQQLISDQKNNKGASCSSNQDQHSYGVVKKSLGTRRGPGSKFVPPVMNREESENDQGKGSFELKSSSTDENFSKDPRLQNIDPNMIERISNEIMDHGPPVSWEDIAGLEFAKKTIKEIVVWPMLRPDIFTGLRGPPKGLLLFGPPGTGKTLIGKCIASQSQSTFFSISASSLTSKWVGEGEKMVRALFGVAKVHQPAVIFIDEIDSLLTQRSDTEHESSRRIKTEFLVQLDGTNTGDEDRILVVGATNRPQEIDEAARRRFVKRLYIPLPELSARKQIIRHLLKKQNHCLSEQDMEQVCLKTEGYSGADMANLCKEAALGPIRRLDFSDIENISADQVQDIDTEDFMTALRQVKASVSDKDLNLYLDWNQRFGSWGM